MAGDPAAICYPWNVDDAAGRAARRRVQWTGGVAHSFREMDEVDSRLLADSQPGEPRARDVVHRRGHARPERPTWTCTPTSEILLAELVRSGVRFVVVGGYAVGYHAKPRATKDLDLLVSGSDGNLARVADALQRFGAAASVVQAARHMGPMDIVFLGLEPVRVDILRSADGVDTEEVLTRAEILDLDDLAIPVMALDDLIANKRASARVRDLADVELLERVRGRR